jgi:uncharacterized protein with HEPN domain
MQKYNLYLNQILENIQKIENSLKGKNKEDLEKEEILKDATYMRIQIIGENVNKIPFKIQNQYPEVEWNRIKDSRDIISHAYTKVNINIIWDLIRIEFPKLKEAINGIYKKE